MYSRAENIHAVRARQKGLEIDFRFCVGYYPFFLSSHTLSVLYIHICIYVTNLSLCTRTQTHPQSYILSAAVLNSFCRHRPTTTTAFSEINTPTPHTRASAFHPLIPSPNTASDVGGAVLLCAYISFIKRPNRKWEKASNLNDFVFRQKRPRFPRGSPKRRAESR